MPALSLALQRPRLPHGLLRRPRLAEMLDHGSPGAVTLVCAGAGWGKTALVASWAGERPGSTTWLTLDATHNDPYAFWSDVVLALKAPGALPAEFAVPDPGSALLADEAVVAGRVARTLAAAPTMTVLVLDDLQAVRDPHVLRQLSGLLINRPDRLRLVLITREEPALPLHRLRAAGHLTEIRAADLAFCVVETGQLLTLLDRRMPADAVAALVRRTEGWAAGLRLMIDASDQAAGRAAVEEYLVEEVFDALPPHLQAFLVRTSIPDRVSGELADALTGQRQGAEALDWLVRSNVFLERAADGRWFRYHQMFRAMLRRRIEGAQPEELARLHLVCARWYIGEGMALAALRHAAAARDWGFVATLVVDHGLPLAASIDRIELFRILRRIPVEQLADSAELVVCAAILLYSYGDLEAIPRRISYARSLLHGDRRSGRLELALALLEIATVVRRRGAMPELISASDGVLARLSRMQFDEVPTMVQYRAIALVNKGVGMLWNGRLDHADSFLWAAATTADIGGMILVRISAFGHLGLLALLRGSLRQAEEHVIAALDLAERVEAHEASSTAVGYLTRSLIESEQGRDVEADEVLRRGLHALGQVPDAAQGVLAGLIRVRLLVDHGEVSAGRAHLRTLREELAPGLVAPMLTRLLSMAESEVDLAEREPAAVLARYGHRPATSELLPPEQILLAQAMLAVHDQHRGEEMLAQAREGPDRVAAVTAWILTALTADAQGHTGRADEAMSRALALAEPERIRRPFRRVDTRRLLSLAERWQWLTDVRRPAGENALADISGELPVVVPLSSDRLSEREMDVMRYLPTVLTAAEIAENLGISVNTVKAHMRAIYRKLGAARRREAVAVARQLGYL